MKLLGEFTFLKLEKGATKSTQDKASKDYLIISLLDEDLNSCRFFIFDERVMTKLLRANLSSYSKLTGVLEVSYYKDNWNVILADVDVNANGK